MLLKTACHICGCDCFQRETDWRLLLVNDTANFLNTYVLANSTVLIGGDELDQKLRLEAQIWLTVEFFMVDKIKRR